MKISNIKITPVNMPQDLPFVWTGGLYPGISPLIIEVETDAGLVGLGEAPSLRLEADLKRFIPRLIGKDPFDIAELENLCVPPWQITPNTDGNSTVAAFGGLELALWDLRGKAWNMPVYKLLGGAVRKEIAFAEYFSFRMSMDGAGKEMDTQAIVEYCLRMRAEHGSTCFEGKLIQGDPELEIQTVRALREALGPRAMLRLDANMQWSLTTARRILREIEPYNIRGYEDPVATFEELAALRRHSSIPFSTHLPDLRRAVAMGVPDFFVTNFAVLGGIQRAVRFIGACEAMGVGFWCYAGYTGISTAAFLHVAAATQWIQEPSQSVLHWLVGDVIKGGPFNPKNNVVQVPEGPGLGIELDPAALKYWHQHYVDHGPMNIYHNPENPGHFRRLPLN